jgi:hypothetical protein
MRDHDIVSDCAQAEVARRLVMLGKTDLADIRSSSAAAEVRQWREALSMQEALAAAANLCGGGGQERGIEGCGSCGDSVPLVVDGDGLEELGKPRT